MKIKIARKSHFSRFWDYFHGQLFYFHGHNFHFFLHFSRPLLFSRAILPLFSSFFMGKRFSVSAEEIWFLNQTSQSESKSVTFNNFHGQKIFLMGIFRRFLVLFFRDIFFFTCTLFIFFTGTNMFSRGRKNALDQRNTSSNPQNWQFLHPQNDCVEPAKWLFYYRKMNYLNPEMPSS